MRARVCVVARGGGALGSLPDVLEMPRPAKWGDRSETTFAGFKVLVTNADGATTVMTLAQLGITSINLTEDSTRVELPDGSVIEGQTTSARLN